MPPGWFALTPDEATATWDLHQPLIAAWQGPGEASVVLYADGLIEVEGDGFPVDLLAHVSVAWHGWLRGKCA